jgi:hypothetical protein
MFRKSTILALTAFAALGLAVSSASAKPGGPGIGNKMPGINGPGVIKPISQIKPIKIIPSNPIKPKPPGVNWPLYPKPGKPVHWPIKPVYHPIYKPVIVSQPVYVAARPVVATPGPCTCLSKEYTPQGAVLFKDRCTTEMAMNPPSVAQ